MHSMPIVEKSWLRHPIFPLFSLGDISAKYVGLQTVPDPVAIPKKQLQQNASVCCVIKIVTGLQTD